MKKGFKAALKEFCKAKQPVNLFLVYCVAKRAARKAGKLDKLTAHKVTMQAYNAYLGPAISV